MRRGFISLIALLWFGVIAGSTGAVPLSISYQGRLTDNLNQPVADDTYTITFHIYAGAAGGSPLWSETRSVPTTDGLFEVLLGQSTPIATDLFNGNTRYLAIAVFGQPESTERIPMVSVPYAMVAGSVAGTTTDCHDCDTVFINATGPETLTATSRTAFTVLNSGTEAREGMIAAIEGESTDTVSAIVGSASNNGTGTTNGGAFAAYSSFNAPINGLYAIAQTPTSNQPATGVYGVGKNFGSGPALGGYFTTPSGGTGQHYGLLAESYSNNSVLCYGIRTVAANDGSGTTFGGYFSSEGGGSGNHYGAAGSTNASTSEAAIGLQGQANNTGSGRAIGGVFIGGSFVGAGQHFGVYSEAAAANDSQSVGVHGIGANFGSGTAYGGLFEAKANGTGLHFGISATATGTDNYAFGVRGSATSSGSGMARGLDGYAYGSGSGYLNGGYFYCVASGTGEGRGSTSFTHGVAGAPLIIGADGGAYGYAGYSGTVYGGNFAASGGSSAGTQYGVYGYSWANGSYSSYGVNGRSEHYGSGTSYGAYFLADSGGTGQSRGIRAVALSKGSAAAYGVMGVSANRVTGDSYGGYFEALNYSGTGAHYGIYAKAPTTGYAGYFSGNIRVTGNQTVLGTKSAAVTATDGSYRLVYSQESPECWFEDFGEGQLLNGRAHIDLDPLFLQTVTIDQANPMKVFIQLNDPDCNGTAVIRGATGFDVVELQNGAGNASFSYRIVAKRRGYENARLDAMPGPTPDQVSTSIERDRIAQIADDEQMERDRQKQEESRAARMNEETISPGQNPR